MKYKIITEKTDTNFGFLCKEDKIIRKNIENDILSDYRYVKKVTGKGIIYQSFSYQGKSISKQQFLGIVFLVRMKY